MSESEPSEAVPPTKVSTRGPSRKQFALVLWLYALLTFWVGWHRRLTTSSETREEDLWASGIVGFGATLFAWTFSTLYIHERLRASLVRDEAREGSLAACSIALGAMASVGYAAACSMFVPNWTLLMLFFSLIFEAVHLSRDVRN
jgi:hypothetical protein